MLIKPETRTAADGLQLRATAEVKRAKAESFDSYGDHWHAEAEREDAIEADRLADDILTLPYEPKIGTGGELHLSEYDETWKPGLACTVEQPNAVNAEASRDRLELAGEAHCLAMAADAAETIQAQNSLEKMLAHQMAAAHAASMRLMARAQDELFNIQYKGPQVRQEAELSATRLMNSAARLMSSFQDGATTLHRLRTGGRQVVTVQHVSVSDGGQAVVAGNLDRTTGGPKGGGKGEK